MTKKRIPVVDARILVMGLTFKENCPVLRNSKVLDVIRELQSFHAEVDVHDPWVDAAEAVREYGVRPIAAPQRNAYDAVVIAVAHREFREMGIERIRALCKPAHVIFDVKYLFAAHEVDGRL